MKRIGMDVGGTFTDIVLLDSATGRTHTVKVPTTTDNPVEGVIAGLRSILDSCRVAPEEIEFIGHGTTIATNLIVEGKASPTALLTTRGFRDVLEIRRASRHDRADLYDLMFSNPPPLVSRHLRREVRERILYDGSVAEPLLEETALAEARAVALEPVEAVAVCFVNAPINAAHERLMVEQLGTVAPHVFVSASSEANPELLEYERTSTTVINAMLGPRCGHYIRALQREVRSLGIRAPVLLMQSNGGLAAPETLADKPIALLESGPAGGVTAAVKLCQRAGISNAILGDMGGTTFDVSLFHHGRTELRTTRLLNSYTVRVPTIDIESVGAGGGSIAWVDEGSGVHVGPQSAGARPGPACYGHGGDRPTVTDCNLVLGYLDAESFLGGAFALDSRAAQRAIETHLAQPLGCSVLEAAAIVRGLANASMAQAIRLMTVERGYDPREFVYVAYGGAGPVHATDLARELEIPRVLVPPMPGLFSAFGMLVADQAHDYQHPVMQVIDEVDAADVAARFALLEARARALFEASGVSGDEIAFVRRADCRYLPQAEALSVELPGASVDAAWIDELGKRFERAHQQHWNFTLPGQPIVLVNLRLRAVVPTSIAAHSDQGDRPASSTPYRERRVFVGNAWASLPTYRRNEIRSGEQIDGPAVIEDASSSLVFAVGQRALCDEAGNLIVEDLG